MMIEIKLKMVLIPKQTGSDQIEVGSNTTKIALIQFQFEVGSNPTGVLVQIHIEVGSTPTYYYYYFICYYKKINVYDQRYIFATLG